MILFECKQGTEEWHTARVGVITASRFEDACSRLKKTGGLTEKAALYAAQLAIERISGKPCDEGFSTWQMKKGQELEPEARMAYEVFTGNLASESGVALTDDKKFGYSTDGFVDAERGKPTKGCIEIKSLSSASLILAMWRTRDVSDYMYQIQGGLWITGRDWCDFVMFCPQLKNVGKELFLKRVYRDDEFISDMEDRLIEFDGVVKENKSIFEI